MFRACIYSPAKKNPIMKWLSYSFSGAISAIIVLQFLILHPVLVEAQNDSKQILTNAQIQERIEGSEALKNKLEQIDYDMLLLGQQEGIGTEVLTLDVIVHVVYSNEGGKVSESSVKAIMNDLNRDFNSDPKVKVKSKVYDQFIPLATNPQIGFRLVEIVYHESKKDKWTQEDDIRNEVRPVNPDKQINIWICGLSDDASGYATMPFFKDETVDGIVIDYRYVASNKREELDNNEGKTLTHLMGNYLGLYSLWGIGPCSDDGVLDTPILSAPTYVCSDARHVSLCYKTPQTVQIMNYMDASPDECQSMFTRGQVARMHAFLAEGGLRNHLIHQK